MKGPGDKELRTKDKWSTVICKGCPLTQAPTRVLARTKDKGGPSQPHPQTHPVRKIGGGKAGVRFPPLHPLGKVEIGDKSLECHVRERLGVLKIKKIHLLLILL
jgi:hypothetical protein